MNASQAPSNLPQVSIIIPTHNRADILRQTVRSLTELSYPSRLLEVIVVDDGSTDSTAEIAKEQFPFQFRYIHQNNAGATEARNFGACQSCGQALVFLDDDIELSPQAVSVLVEVLQTSARTIALGYLKPVLLEGSGVFSRLAPAIHYYDPYLQAPDSPGKQAPYPVPFSECKTGVLAVWRGDFNDLGKFRDPTGSWPNWDDVEFGYRAHLAQYTFLRCPQAIGCHHDYAMADMKASCRRTERAAAAAVLLFQRYPGLFPHLEMFHDKTPISLQNDSPGLVLHKTLHTITSWSPVLYSMEKLAGMLENIPAPAALLVPLYRWISSSYIQRGFRSGLRQYGMPGGLS